MEKETKQRKPYNRVQCKLITYGRDSVMFAVSWSDKCGLTPIGMATLKNIHYQMSLSEEERYSYNRRILRDFVWLGHYGDYPCWGYWIQGPSTPLGTGSLGTGTFNEACAMNTPFYQNLPNNGELVNVCGPNVVQFPPGSPSLSDYVC